MCPSNSCDQPVTAIIATTAEISRKRTIERALSSIRSQRHIKNTIVIVNGHIFDESVIQWLKTQNRVNFHYIEEGCYPKALAYGHSLVDTEYFCFLDDDDELLPDSIELRLKKAIDTKADVVVGNGVRVDATGNSRVIHENIRDYQNDPAAALFGKNGNWLASCAGLYKTASISDSYFNDYAKYAEWTYLAAKLSLKCRIQFIPDLTYRVNYSPQSLSNSTGYLEGLYNVQNKLISLNFGNKIQKKLLRRKADSAHDVAYNLLRVGKLGTSFKYHLISLYNFSGFFRYFSFTRKYIYELLNLGRQTR